MAKHKWHKRTQAVHAGSTRSQYGELSEAMVLTQAFVYDTAEQAAARFVDLGDDEYIYTRYGNPTVRMFENRLAAIEGTEACFATASGMAAVSAVLLASLQAGDHVVSARALFGSCLYVVKNILPRYGIEVTLIDGTDKQQWQQAIRKNTKMVFLESVSNPTLELVDVAHVASLARRVGALVVVDNVFATPVFVDMPALGADVVIYSTTKHIDGQGRCLGGAICAQREFIKNTIEPFMRNTGGAMSPFNAWVMLKGLETLDLRCCAQAETAQYIANALCGHANVAQVIYPFLPNHPHYALAQQTMRAGGTVVTFEVRGGQTAAFQFLNALQLIIISNNLGDAKSLITHPATTTHHKLTEQERAALSISGGLVRLSIGLEDKTDLIRDLDQALQHIRL